LNIGSILTFTQELMAKEIQSRVEELQSQMVELQVRTLIKDSESLGLSNVHPRVSSIHAWLRLQFCCHCPDVDVRQVTLASWGNSSRSGRVTI
jgi:hypothetical protein